jgi:hypothetical protein
VDGLARNLNKQLNIWPRTQAHWHRPTESGWQWQPGKPAHFSPALFTAPLVAAASPPGFHPPRLHDDASDRRKHAAPHTRRTRRARRRRRRAWRAAESGFNSPAAVRGGATLRARRVSGRRPVVAEAACYGSLRQAGSLRLDALRRQLTARRRLAFGRPRPGADGIWFTDRVDGIRICRPPLGCRGAVRFVFRGRD